MTVKPVMFWVLQGPLFLLISRIHKSTYVGAVLAKREEVVGGSGLRGGEAEEGVRVVGRGGAKPQDKGEG